MKSKQNTGVQKLNNTLQKVSNLMLLSDKLLISENQSNKLVIVDYDKYQAMKLTELFIINFITTNHWFFLPKIIKSIKNESLKLCNDCELEMILHSDYEYLKIGIAFPVKKSIYIGKYLKINTINKVLNNINNRILGNILAKFNSTSLSTILQYHINYK